jgi:hypothetical protein
MNVDGVDCHPGYRPINWGGSSRNISILRLSDSLRKGTEIVSEQTPEVTNQDNQGQSGSNQPASQSVTQSPPQSPPQSHSAPAQPAGTPFVAELRDALNALPERLVNALREATPQTPAEPTQKRQRRDDSDSDSERDRTSQADKAKTPGKRTFAEMWFD